MPRKIESLSYVLLLNPGDSAALECYEYSCFMKISTLIKCVGNDIALDFVLRILKIKNHMNEHIRTLENK